MIGGEVFKMVRPSFCTKQKKMITNPKHTRLALTFAAFVPCFGGVPLCVCLCLCLCQAELPQSESASRSKRVGASRGCHMKFRDTACMRQQVSASNAPPPLFLHVSLLETHMGYCWTGLRCKHRCRRESIGHYGRGVPEAGEACGKIQAALGRDAG